MKINENKTLIFFLFLMVVFALVYLRNYEVETETQKTCVSEIEGQISRLERHNGMVKIFIEGDNNHGYLLSFSIGEKNNDASFFLIENKKGDLLIKQKNSNIVNINSKKWIIDCD